MHTILLVFPVVGTTLTIQTAFDQLRLAYTAAGVACPSAKAAGSIGGAVNGGTIVRRNGSYIRVR